MFRAFVSVIYIIHDKFICIDYLSFHQDKLSKHDKTFSNTRFDNLSGIGIPDVLTNLMLCHGFFKEQQYTVILTWQRTLV